MTSHRDVRRKGHEQKVSLPTLTAMVVGSMIGSGVFLLPRRFGAETGVLGAIIAWTIAGAGMLMLAFVFQRLATRKPDLDAGIFAYAKAGFGDYVGFNSAFGFWASACAGNTSYWVVIMTTTSALFPALGAGDTVLAVIVSSVGVWLFVYLILRGVKEAAIINRIATVAKVVPILVFIVIAAIAFKGDVFADNFWGGDDRYVLVGLRAGQGHDADHGVRVPRHRGRQRLLAVRPQTRGRRTRDGHRIPQCAQRFRPGDAAVVWRAAAGRAGDGSTSRRWGRCWNRLSGTWGSVFIRVGVVCRCSGAYLAWTLMAAEILYIPAKTDDMPRFLARTNSNGAPVPALMMAAGLIQLLLILLLFTSECAGFHARPHRGTVADPVPAGRGVHAEADGHARDLRDRQITWRATW